MRGSLNYGKIKITLDIDQSSKIYEFKIQIGSNPEEKNNLIFFVELTSLIEAFLSNQIPKEYRGYYDYKVIQKNKIPYLAVIGKKEIVVLNKPEARIYLKFLKIIENKLVIRDILS